MLMAPDFTVSLAISLGFVIPNFLIVVTIMMPNASDASASNVLYPSIKPFNNTLLL